MPKDFTDSVTKRRDGSSSPSKRPRSKNVTVLKAQDKTQWRPSRLPASSTINKSAAQKNYHLSAIDLDGLPFQKSETVIKIYGTDTTRPMYLYMERDVELKAWEKHGGPEGFKNFLDLKRAKYYDKHGRNSGKVFPQPSSYTTITEPASQGGVWICTPPKHRPDRETSTPNLLRMKQSMEGDGKQWLWEELNRRLCDAGLDERKRETIMMEAARTMVPLYPLRPPSSPPRQSPSFDALDLVLDDAPVSGSQDAIEGIDVHYSDGERSISWAQSYSDKVYGALIKIIKEHGREGWESARWLVYDKYVDCEIGHIFPYEVMDFYVNFYSPTGKYSWSDSAYFWLDESDHSKPGSSQLCLRYNKLVAKILAVE